MTASRRLCAPALLALVLLGGCVGGLLGGGKPDALYRFGVSEQNIGSLPEQRPESDRTITLLRIRFAPEIDGDRLLATRGESALYIEGARWVAAAPDLFSQALGRTFRNRAPAVRLIPAQNGDPSDYALEISITRFEAHYATAGPDEVPPMVLMEGDATLYGPGNRKAVTVRHVSTQAAAGANRAGAIVAAFDGAAGLFTAQVVDWVNGSALTARNLRHRVSSLSTSSCRKGFVGMSLWQGDFRRLAEPPFAWQTCDRAEAPRSQLTL